MANMLGAVALWGWRPPVALIEWLMGLPDGWSRTASEDSGTP